MGAVVGAAGVGAAGYGSSIVNDRFADTPGCRGATQQSAGDVGVQKDRDVGQRNRLTRRRRSTAGAVQEHVAYQLREAFRADRTSGCLRSQGS